MPEEPLMPHFQWFEPLQELPLFVAASPHFARMVEKR
jgi:hypothetical protein